MRPLAEFSASDRRGIKVLLSDIDDTMTTDGRLPAATLAALEDLAAAGIKLVPVTGRPAGWCDHIARMWPVDAVVGENGALWFSYDRKTRKMHSHFAKSEQERKEDRARLDALQRQILDAVPGAGIASDQFCRIADLAIDFCEDVEPLCQASIDRIVKMFEDAGAVAKVSSIHVNGWFGAYDKKSMTAHCLSTRFGLDIDRDNSALVFAGDSPNDQPMFEHFIHGVGVANVRDFTLDHCPRWVTQSKAGDGFVELAEALLQVR
ncbi:Haloacid dehalogenase-like hydrolase [hydrothermal vent metagenome]|uniref:Haloacid dehalogenase-like hydrolase n=1 Tax=hydrothermal vent metagenome TaxID=652676 RepID=A0A3B0TJN4_9ZZZZ